MVIKEIREPDEQQRRAFRDLWNSEYPVNLAYSTQKEFELYLRQLGEPGHLVLEDEGGHVAGWAFDFVRENERWFGIILKRSAQKKGYGKRLLDLLKERHPVLNGWMIDHDRYQLSDGSQYLSPSGFYRKQGFRFFPEDRLGLDRVSVIRIRWQHEK